MPLDNPSDNLFRIYMDELPAGNPKVYLTYELYGLTGSESVSRSINSRAAFGGYAIKKNNEWTTQKEEIDASWLRKGENTLLFTIPQGAAYQYKVKNIKIEISYNENTNTLLVLNDSNIRLTKDGKIYIKGFIRNASDNVKVFVGNHPVNLDKGEFEAIVPIENEDKMAKFIAVRAVENRKVLGQELLFTDNIVEADNFYTIEKKANSLSKDFEALKPGELIYKGAVLKVRDSALAATATLTVRQLRGVDTAPMESGIINVTKGCRAYRFLPDGTKFSKEVNISIPYDSLLLPAGYSVKDIRTYFFDTHTKHWTVLKKDTLDIKNKIVTSYTTHFTDYINGIIQSPDSPETAAFTPTMMSDVKTADPSAEMTLIAPPQVSQNGTANISYPIKVPAGRQGMQPSLGIHYSNDGGTGWLGEGWSLNTPSLSIDTRWGAPIFDPQKETELYSLNGEMLMYPGDNENPLDRGYMPHRHQGTSTLTTDQQARSAHTINGVKKFLPRKQGGFEKIERLGNGPSKYYWKVTDSNGTISWYGGDSSQSVEVGNAVLRNPQSNIVHWALYKVEDVFGNYMTYHYTNEFISSSIATAENANLLNGRIFYLSNIYYTANGAVSPALTANYEVDFIINYRVRADATISNRLGLKQIDPFTLAKIFVKHNPSSPDPIRTYTMEYSTGKMGKSRLESITEAGIDDIDHYTHTFEYYDDITQGVTDVYFGDEIELNMCDPDDPVPCIDSDGDGVCDADDACPDEAGTLPNGCNPDNQGNNCFNVTIEIPTIYQYTYTSPVISGHSTSCYGVPMAVNAISFGQIGSTNPTSNPSNLYLTNYNGSNVVNLCPQTPQTNYTGVQYSGFNTDMENYLNTYVFPGLDIHDVTVHNYSSVSGSYEWGFQNYYTLSFQSAFSDLTFSSSLIYSGFNGMNIAFNVTNENLTSAISTTGMPVPVLVNGQPLAMPSYNLQSNLSGFISAFQQQYPQAQITTSGNFITIHLPNTSAVLNTISINGDQYSFTTCNNTSPRLAMSTPAIPVNYFANPENNYTISFDGSATGGDPDCPSFLNLDFLIQGNTPSFQSAGAVLGSTKATSFTAGGYIGVGIGASIYTNTTTFGGGYTHGWDKAESLTQMIDIDGDGLEDIVFNDNNTIYYKKHTITVSLDANNQVQVNHAFGLKTEIHGMDKFYRQEGTSDSFNFDASMNFGSFGAFAGKDTATSKAEADIYFTDGNGDGLPDIVRHERVYFNHLDSNGIPYFENFSDNTENLVITAEPLQVTVPEEYYESEIEYPKNDVVKVWEAPADGTIKIINNIELTDTSKQSMVTVEMPVPSAPGTQCYVVQFPIPVQTQTSYRRSAGINSIPVIFYNIPITACIPDFWGRMDALKINGFTHLAPINLYAAHGDITGHHDLCPDTSYQYPICFNDVSLDYDLNSPCTDIRSPDFMERAEDWYFGTVVPYYPDIYETEVHNGSRLMWRDDLYNSQLTLFSAVSCSFSFKTLNPNYTMLSHFYSRYDFDPNHVASSSWSGYLGSSTLQVGLNANITINSTAMPQPYNIYNDFTSFKAAIQGLYPNAQVYRNGNTITITSPTTLNNLSVATVSGGTTQTYNFSPGACDGTTPSGGRLAATVYNDVKPSRSEIETAFLQYNAEGKELEEPIEPKSLIGQITVKYQNRDAEYHFVKSEKAIEWYSTSKEIVEDKDLLAMLNKSLTFNPDDAFKYVNSSINDEIYKYRAEKRDKAIAKLKLLYGKYEPQSMPSYQIESANPATCNNEPQQLCQLFGAQLSAANSVINTTITNYSTACDPSQNILYVKKGDRIYFRVHSIDTGNPAVNWDPQVEYTDSTLAATTDENGLLIYKSNYSDGFILSEPVKETIFTGNGTAEFTWPVVAVNNPSDKVTFEIVKKVITGPEASYGSLPETVIYRKTCNPGSSNTVSADVNEIAGVNLAAYAVSGYAASNNSNPNSQSATAFYFRVKSTSNVNWKAYEWRPKMLCQTTQQIIGDAGTSEGDVPLKKQNTRCLIIHYTVCIPAHNPITGIH